jgi:hypothetical protein
MPGLVLAMALGAHVSKLGGCEKLPILLKGAITALVPTVAGALLLLPPAMPGLPGSSCPVMGLRAPPPGPQGAAPGEVML